MFPLKLGKGFDLLRILQPGLEEGLELVTYLKYGPLAGDDRSFDDTFQFPHVARPLVFQEVFQSFFSNRVDFPADFFVEFGDKMVDQQRMSSFLCRNGGIVMGKTLRR